jgi:3D (Asp-Asp-Asp) domain-containing protein
MKKLKKLFKNSGNYAVAAGLIINIASANILPAAISAEPGEPSLSEAILTTSLTNNAAADLTRTMTVTLTAYSSTPDQTDDTPFISASNKHVYDGMIAANFLPFGTKVQIPKLFGDKIFTVDDRMNRRYQDRVDIWFPDRKSAIQFGIKQAEIIILL